MSAQNILETRFAKVSQQLFNEIEKVNQEILNYQNADKQSPKTHLQCYPIKLTSKSGQNMVLLTVSAYQKLEKRLSQQIQQNQTLSQLYKTSLETISKLEGELSKIHEQFQSPKVVYVEKLIEVPSEKIITIEVLVQKQVPVPVTVEKEVIIQKRVQIPIEKAVIIERIVQVPVVQDKIVQKIVFQRVQVEVVREIEVPKIVEVEKIIEVQKIVEVVVEKFIEVPVDRIVYIQIEKIVQIPVEKIVQIPVEKIVQIPVEKIVEVEKIIEKQIVVEKIVQKPIQKIVTVFKQIEVPVQVIKYMEQPAKQTSVENLVLTKIVEIPVFIEKIVEKLIPVEKIIQVIIEKPIQKLITIDRIVEVQRIKEVDKPIYIERIIEVQRPVQKIGDRIVQIPIQRPAQIQKIVHQPVERIVQVEKPIDRIIQIQKTVQVPVYRMIKVEKIVEVVVEKPVQVIVWKTVEIPVEKIIEIQVTKENPVTQIVEVARIVRVQADEVVQIQVDTIGGQLGESHRSQKGSYNSRSYCYSESMPFSQQALAIENFPANNNQSGQNVSYSIRSDRSSIDLPPKRILPGQQTPRINILSHSITNKGEQQGREQLNDLLSQINELREQLQEANQKLIYYQSIQINSASQERLIELQNQYEKLRNICKQLEQINEQLNSDNKSYEQTLHQLNQKNQQYQQRLYQKEQLIAEIEQKYEAISNNILNQDSQNWSKRDAFEKTEQELMEQIDRGREEMEGLQNSVDLLEKQIRGARYQIRTLAAKNDHLEAHSKALSEIIDEKSANQQILLQQIENYKKRAEQIPTELYKKNRQFQSIVEQRHYLVENLKLTEEQLDDIKEENQKLQEGNTVKDQQLLSLSRKVLCLQRQLNMEWQNSLRQSSNHDQVKQDIYQKTDTPEDTQLLAGSKSLGTLGFGSHSVQFQGEQNGRTLPSKSQKGSPINQKPFSQHQDNEEQLFKWTFGYRNKNSKLLVQSKNQSCQQDLKQIFDVIQSSLGNSEDAIKVLTHLNNLCGEIDHRDRVNGQLKGIIEELESQNKYYQSKGKGRDQSSQNSKAQSEYSNSLQRVLRSTERALQQCQKEKVKLLTENHNLIEEVRKVKSQIKKSVDNQADSIIEQLIVQSETLKIKNEELQNRLKDANTHLIEAERQLFEKDETINYLNFSFMKKSRKGSQDESYANEEASFYKAQLTRFQQANTKLRGNTNKLNIGLMKVQRQENGKNLNNSALVKRNQKETQGSQGDDQQLFQVSLEVFVHECGKDEKTQRSLIVKLFQMFYQHTKDQNFSSYEPRNIIVNILRKADAKKVEIRTITSSHLATSLSTELLFIAPQLIQQRDSRKQIKFTEASAIWNAAMLVDFIISKQPFFSSFKAILDYKGNYILRNANYTSLRQSLQLMMSLQPQQRPTFLRIKDSFLFKLNTLHNL